ncbi:MAG: hypothetical protein ABEH59_02150 [Halobacteriales archaeon]
MNPRTWVVPIAEDSTVDVATDADQSSAEWTVYRLRFPFIVNDSAADDIVVSGEGTLRRHEVRSDGGLPVSDMTVRVPNADGVERLAVATESGRLVIYLPGDELLEACERTIAGDDAAAETVVAAFASPVRIPLVAGAFLDTADTVELVRAVTAADHHVASMLHSYRYPVVRSALVSRSGLSVRSWAALETLVEGLDGIADIGDVSAIDALADVMATVHGSIAETDRLFDRLGVDPTSDRRDPDGLLAACYLAHRVVCAGFEAAVGYDIESELPATQNYDRRKRGAFRAEYGQRGTAWRSLLDAAREQSEEEFGFVLAKTLYWTAEESRSDARLAELLFRGAETVAAEHNQVRVKVQSRYKRHLAAGHRLRSAHCFEAAIDQFERTCQLAEDYRFLEPWEPLLARGLVQAHLLRDRGDHRGAVARLDDTIEAVLASEPPTEAANHAVHHITAQKAETRALGDWAAEPALARASLEEARDHYAAIGYGRSQERVERKLAELEEATTAGTEDDTPPAPDQPVPVSVRSDEAGTDATSVEAGRSDAGPDPDAPGPVEYPGPEPDGTDAEGEVDEPTS